MKTKYFIQTLLMLFIALTTTAQQGINYKAIINDADGNLLANTAITIQFTILENGTTTVYSEMHDTITDANGILIVNIGEGSVLSGDFNTIQWGSAPHYLKTEIDKGEGLVDMGTTEFKTVPYALHAFDVANKDDDDADPANELQQLSVAGNQLTISEGNTISLPVVASNGFPVYSSAEISELSPVMGDAVFNSTELLYQVYDGTSWQVFNTNCWPEPTIADAGPDQVIGEGITSVMLSGNVPEAGHGTGEWTITTGEGGSISDATNPNATFTGELFEIYTLRWTVSTSCSISEDEVKFIFFQEVSGPILSDIDGNSYNTVVIGDQIWMAENLKTTKYNDGTSIPLVTDYTEWSNLNSQGYCWYDNDQSTYGNTYGALYNWYTVNTGNLCPAGWHVPTDEEWTTLITYLGGEDVAGGFLKETGTTHWNSPNTGTNQTGFTAVPGGYRYYNGGSFNTIGFYGYWWSATEYSSTDAWYRSMTYDFSSVTRSGLNKQFGFSVRCLRD
jgi:uncharacterized protein (TIGR02145 family)